MKKPEKKEDEDKSQDQDIQIMITDSHLLSGGIEHRLAYQVFNKKTLKVIDDLSLVVGEQNQGPNSHNKESEDDKLVQAIITEGQNEHVDRLISILQSFLEKRRPPIMWARLNGAGGLRLSRAAFGCLIKFSDQFEMFQQLVDQAEMQFLDLEQDPDRDNKLKEAVKTFPGFDGINSRWESASKMRSWINDHKNILREKIEESAKKESAGKNETELDAIIDKQYDQEMSDMYDKVIKKADFLVKLSVPDEFFAKAPTKEKDTINFIKESLVKAMKTSEAEKESDQLQSTEKMKRFQSKIEKEAQKIFNNKKKSIFESSVTSILAYLQAPIDLKNIQDHVEQCFLVAKKRATGLKILSLLLNFEFIPKSHRYDLIMWFSCALRANKNEITHYLDGLKGCGSFLQDQIRLSFFGIIKQLLGQLQNQPDETDIKVILNSLRWKYLGKDHSGLKYLEIFRTLYNGGWYTRDEKGENLIEKSWGKSIQQLVQTSEDEKPLTQMLLSLFENIFLSVLSRVLREDEQASVHKTNTPLSMERAQSIIDENATENLLLQGFDIIFRELQRYIDFAQSYQGIDWNTYLSYLESPENKPLDENLQKNENRGPVQGSARQISEAGTHSEVSEDEEESKGFIIDETPSAFNEDKLQKIAGDTDTPVDLHIEEETKDNTVQNIANADDAKDRIFSKEEESKMLTERKSKQSEEFKKLEKLYSEGFLKRILRLLETYTSLATTSMIPYLQPLERPAVMKNLINVFLLSNPRIKLVVLKIIQNLITINFPFELFEDSISLLQKDQNSSKAQQIIVNGSKFQIKGSKFIEFFYSYLIQVRRKIYHDIGVENEGTYAVTSEVVRFLRFLAEESPQEEFRRAIRKKMSNYLSLPVDQWIIDESDLILSLFNGGSFTSLMTGSHALFKEQQRCVILGFSEQAVADSDLKVLPKEVINKFTSSIYCTDPIKQKALVLFLSDGIDGTTFVPEVRAVDIHNLNPIHNIISNTHEKSLLYNRDVIVNLLKVLSINVDENSTLVVRQSQIQIIKILSTLITHEHVESGHQHPEFLKFLEQENLLLDLFGFLQRNAKKPQIFNQSELNLPNVILELSLTQLRIKAQESQICLLTPNESVANFSQYDNTLMIFEQNLLGEKASTYLVTAEIQASINEATLCKMQLNVNHQVTLFSQVKANPSLLTSMNFDLLFVDSSDLVTPESESAVTLLSQSLLNTNIVIMDDQFDTLMLYEAIQNLEQQIPTTQKLEPLDHKPIFIIDRDSFLQIQNKESKLGVKVDQYEQPTDSFSQFMLDLKELAGYNDEQINKIKARDGSKESNIKEVQDLWDQVQAGGSTKLTQDEAKVNTDLKKLLVGNSSNLLRNQQSTKENQSVFEDIGELIFNELIEDSDRSLLTIVNTQLEELKEAVQSDSGVEINKEKSAVLSKIITGGDNDSQIYKKYVEISNKILRLRSRTALANFLHYMDPLPKSIFNSFESIEKLILISFNEAMNDKLLTGSKTFLNQVIGHINRLFNDPSMKIFVNDFLNNFVIKPSLQVIKKIASDKHFMKKEVIQSEVDASMYPLPSFIYHLTKCLLSKNLGVFKRVRGLSSNIVSILLGHVLAYTIKDPSQVTIQCKYLALASRLLTTVRASVTSNSEEALDWADHLKDIAENQLLNKIDVRGVTDLQKPEQIRLLNELMFEWYNIVYYYQSTAQVKNIKFLPNNSCVQFQKKYEYLTKRDPLNLFQVSCNDESDSVVLQQAAKGIKMIAKTFKQHPSNIVVPFIMKLTKTKGSEVLIVKSENEEDMSRRIQNFDQKGFKDERGSYYIDTIYAHYTASMEQNFGFCGWSKDNRLPNGIKSADTYSKIEVERSYNITHISSCNSGTVMQMKNLKNDVYFTGKLKSSKDQGDQKIQNIEFKDPSKVGIQIKFVTAGKSNLAVVLQNDDIMMYGHNKDSHFDQSETVQDYWYKQKLSPKIFKAGEETIVDIGCGAHFTLVVTNTGKMLGTGKQFLALIGAVQEEPGKFRQIQLDEGIQAKRVWCSRGKNSYLAIIEVLNTSTQETYLMSAGQNINGLLGQGNDEPIGATFKKLDYDHTKIKFTKVSMLTRHALALTESGELYGWGSNQEQRLSLEGVPNALKPTPIARFNDKNRFKLIDIAAGDDHSLVHLKETDQETQIVRYRTYQIGFSEEQEQIEHRGGVTKEELLVSGGIAPVPRLENLKIDVLCCGTKTTFFQAGEETIPAKGEPRSIKELPGHWADYKLIHDIIPKGGLSKRGYLHLFRASQTQVKDITLEERLYGADTFEKNASRISIKYNEGQFGSYDIINQNPANEVNVSKFKVARGELGEGKDLINQGWLCYSQSEIQYVNRPQVSIVLRHAIPNLADKIEVLEELLKQSQAAYTEEAKSDVFAQELHKDVLCKQQGNEIVGARYYASYKNHEGELIEINLSEEAFAEPTEFDLLPLPYVRFASPLPEGAKLPEPVDLTRLHSTDQPLAVSFKVHTSPLNYNNRNEIVAILNTIDSEDSIRKMFISLLKNGNKFEKAVNQFIKENQMSAEIDGFHTFLQDEKKNILNYVKGDKSDGDSFSSAKKKLLNNLAKLIKENTFSELQHSFQEAALYQKVAHKLYPTLSERQLKRSHPESLPFFRKKLLQSLTFNVKSQIIQEKIMQLKCGKMIYITINRRKAQLFAETGECDHKGVHTVFGQIYQELKKKPDSFDSFKQNKTDEQCLSIRFKDEGSVDAGGPFREAMTSICKELMSTILPLLIPTPNNKNNHGQYRECWMVNPSSTSPSHLELFKFFGIFIGHAIRSQQAMPLELAPIFWKLLLQETGQGVQSDKDNEQDLKAFDTFSWKALDNLRLNGKQLTEETFEDGVDEYFVTILSNGAQVELCTGGKSKRVTKQNFEEYFNLVVNVRLTESDKQMRAIREGLNFIMPLQICDMLNWQIVEVRATGTKTIDVEKLKAITSYWQCEKEDEIVKIFWQVLESFSDEEKSMYLKFVWGRARLPATTKEWHEIHAMEFNPNSCLPVSHTCFFKLDLPRYPSFEIARDKILFAIQYCGDIDNT